VAEEMRVELAGLMAKGLTHDQVVEYYVKKYGSQEVLASPIDKGFNRLAWLLPYGAGALGVVIVGRVAFSWSRRRAAAPPAEPAAHDEALESKLDDELRDLD
jgi:cytochrome c-type biogenesis protein CcmH/NrfF